VSDQSVIDSLIPGAVAVQLATGLPAAVLISQVILETGYLGSVTKDLNSGVSSNNLYNIKGTYQGQSVQAWTTEYINGVAQKMIQTFRKYPSFKESFADYAALITGDPVYARAVAVKDNPWQYANILQTCGYATDPSYAADLSALMQQWNLVNRVEEAIEMSLFTQDPATGAVCFNRPVQDWEKDAVQEAQNIGLLTSAHNPVEVISMAESCAILVNFLKTKNLV
jgi:flagellum-specific peptidoglycan hydrolase FlgJ